MSFVITFACEECHRSTSADELEIGARGEQLCAGCAKATGQLGAFERSLGIDMSGEEMMPLEGDVDGEDWP